MWFFAGMVCGVLLSAAVAAGAVRGRGTSDVERSGRRAGASPRREWVQTRNFLYYDGTEMPIVKEEDNEQ